MLTVVSSPVRRALAGSVVNAAASIKAGIGTLCVGILR